MHRNASTTLRYANELRFKIPAGIVANYAPKYRVIYAGGLLQGPDVTLFKRILLGPWLDVVFNQPQLIPQIYSRYAHESPADSRSRLAKWRSR